jgi:peptidoglycan/LPS O-acetylase OafA/YrhL
MPQRFNAGQLIVMVGAAALLVSLFVDWYDPDLNAWEIFEIADVVLAGLALAAIAAALPMRLPGEVGQTTARFDRKLPWIGLAAVALMIVTLINDPPAAHDLDHEFGIWLGLIGAALMAAGGFLITSRISIVVTSRPAAAEAPPPTPAERVERDATAATRPLDHETERRDPQDPPPPPR